MFPKYKDLQIPLLAELIRRGGEASPSSLDENSQTVYEVLADLFDISEDAKKVMVREGNGVGPKWNNMTRWARNDLRKLGFLTSPKRGIWQVTDEGKRYLAQVGSELNKETLINNLIALDLETFYIREEEAKRIGELGERFVVSYERKRLQQAGLANLASMVRQISLENVAAGYDILSFDETAQEMYIEVKTSKAEYSRFILTANELSMAKRLQDAYWIYRVSNIEKSPSILKLCNPAKLIEDGRLLLTPSTYLVAIGENL